MQVETHRQTVPLGFAIKAEVAREKARTFALGVNAWAVANKAAEIMVIVFIFKSKGCNVARIGLRVARIRLFVIFLGESADLALDLLWTARNARSLTPPVGDVTFMYQLQSDSV